jgi:hypothetical protein
MQLQGRIVYVTTHFIRYAPSIQSTNEMKPPPPTVSYKPFLTSNQTTRSRRGRIREKAAGPYIYIMHGMDRNPAKKPFL